MCIRDHVKKINDFVHSCPFSCIVGVAKSNRTITATLWLQARVQTNKQKKKTKRGLNNFSPKGTHGAVAYLPSPWVGRIIFFGVRACVWVSPGAHLVTIGELGCGVLAAAAADGRAASLIRMLFLRWAFFLGGFDLRFYNPTSFHAACFSNVYYRLGEQTASPNVGRCCWTVGYLVAGCTFLGGVGVRKNEPAWQQKSMYFIDSEIGAKYLYQRQWKHSPPVITISSVFWMVQKFLTLLFLFGFDIDSAFVFVVNSFYEFGARS